MVVGVEDGVVLGNKSSELELGSLRRAPQSTHWLGSYPRGSFPLDVSVMGDEEQPDPACLDLACRAAPSIAELELAATLYVRRFITAAYVQEPHRLSIDTLETGWLQVRREPFVRVHGVFPIDDYGEWSVMFQEGCAGSGVYAPRAFGRRQI